ncbi:hypothetical protein N752_18670 [Desulforamulus aquiferis]|nr:hypothetical protein N752_18670 [Desulforamulus aquiferis]
MHHLTEMEKIKELENLSQGKIKYAGTYTPDDIGAIMKTADVGIVPSYFETYCLTAREFLIYGKPIIAAETFGINEIVKDNINGLLFPVGSWQELRNAVHRIITEQNLLNSLTLGAGQTKVFTLKEEVEQLEELYYEVLGNWVHDEGVQPQKMI